MCCWAPLGWHWGGDTWSLPVMAAVEDDGKGSRAKGQGRRGHTGTSQDTPMHGHLATCTMTEMDPAWRGAQQDHLKASSVLPLPLLCCLFLSQACPHLYCQSISIPSQPVPVPMASLSPCPPSACSCPYHHPVPINTISLFPAPSLSPSPVPILSYPVQPQPLRGWWAGEHDTPCPMMGTSSTGMGTPNTRMGTPAPGKGTPTLATPSIRTGESDTCTSSARGEPG